jgi:aromatic ring-cleaving dioxygenase
MPAAIVMTKPEPAEITAYHAHIYYDADSRQRAEHVRAVLGERFNVRLGPWHDTAVGPHPKSMYQVAFEVEEFARVVPWLMLNRQALDVLVHPETGDDLMDHTAHAVWLGNRLELNTHIFKKT